MTVLIQSLVREVRSDVQAIQVKVLVVMDSYRVKDICLVDSTFRIGRYKSQVSLFSYDISDNIKIRSYNLIKGLSVRGCLMLVLSKSPVIGGSLVIQVSMQNYLGDTVFPLTVRYRLAAKKDSGSYDWEYISDPVTVTTSSNVARIILKDLDVVEGYNLERRIVVEASYMDGGQTITDVEAVSFSLLNMPSIGEGFDPPVEEPLPVPYAYDNGRFCFSTGSNIPSFLLSFTGFMKDFSVDTGLKIYKEESPETEYSYVAYRLSDNRSYILVLNTTDDFTDSKVIITGNFYGDNLLAVPVSVMCNFADKTITEYEETEDIEEDTGTEHTEETEENAENI